MKSNYLFLILLVLFFIPSSMMAQYENKTKIYFNFNKEIEGCPYNKIQFKLEKESGIQFNLCGKAVLLSPKESVAVKLPISELCYINFLDASQISESVQLWNDENRAALEEYYDGPFPFYGKNFMFETYVVETIVEEGYIYIYSVIWPNDDNLASTN